MGKPHNQAHNTYRSVRTLAPDPRHLHALARLFGPISVSLFATTRHAIANGQSAVLVRLANIWAGWAGVLNLADVAYASALLKNAGTAGDMHQAEDVLGTLEAALRCRSDSISRNC